MKDSSPSSQKKALDAMYQLLRRVSACRHIGFDPNKASVSDTGTITYRHPGCPLCRPVTVQAMGGNRLWICMASSSDGNLLEHVAVPA